MLIVVFTPEGRNNEFHILQDLFNCGLEILHLRKPGFSLEALRNYILKIPAEYHCRIVLHSHHELLSEFDLMGVHFPEQQRLSITNTSPAFAVSTSYHSLDELVKGEAQFRYVFLSPIFNSISKEGYYSPFNLEELRMAIPHVKSPVVALGGVDETNLELIKTIGFAGAGLLGAIWQSSNPVEKYLTIKSKLTE